MGILTCENSSRPFVSFISGNGFLITFYAERSRMYQGQPIVEWLLSVAQQMKLGGATVINATHGMDHRGQIHSAGFFELADQPVQIQFAVNDEQATALFEFLEDKAISLFYVKQAVEYGVIGQSSLRDG